jgi:hypothetical protein
MSTLQEVGQAAYQPGQPEAEDGPTGPGTPPEGDVVDGEYQQV